MIAVSHAPGMTALPGGANARTAGGAASICVNRAENRSR